MKKILIVLLVVLLLLGGLFFYKGGHHALVLADALDDWLDADTADQSVTIEYQRPGNLPHLALTADTFWTEYADERILGLSAEGITAYLRGRNLYLDTGKAYTLPEMPELKQSLKRLSQGLLLYGRVTKRDDIYHISMKTEELELDLTTDRFLRSITVYAVLPDGAILNGTLTSKEPLPQPISQTVADAMNQTAPPMSLTEPLEVLLPAAENLLPLTGDLKLGVSCGILEVSETVVLELCDGKAALIRKGNRLELPVELSDLSPLAMVALLLRDGDFTRTESGAEFIVNLPAEAATELLETLVPQVADLGITLGNSALCLYITDNRLNAASLTAAGSVPFLFTTIPVDFSAELTVS